MAAKPVEVKVRGGVELVVGSKRLFRQIDDAARGRFLTVAGDAAGRVRARVPRLTGRLAGVGRHRDDRRRSALLRMGRGLPYSGWIEFGGVARPADGPPRPVRVPDRTGVTADGGAAARYAAESEIRGFSWPKVR